MNNEIKCPKCGEIFSIDENYYASIVKQVKDKEFSKELQNKEVQFEKDKENLVQLTKLELEKEFNKELSKKEAEIEKLKSEIETNKISSSSELDKIENKLKNFNKDKDLKIANIVSDYSNKISAQETFILKLTNENELAEKEHKLREQNLKEQYESKLHFKGIVEIDKYYEGSPLKNMHYDKKLAVKKKDYQNKKPLQEFVERNENAVIRAVKDMTESTLNAGIFKYGSTLYTADNPESYEKLPPIYKRGTVVHNKGNYVSKENKNTHTNTIESVWATLSRTLGTYIHVSKKTFTKLCK